MPIIVPGDSRLTGQEVIGQPIPDLGVTPVARVEIVRVTMLPTVPTNLNLLQTITEPIRLGTTLQQKGMQEALLTEVLIL